MWLSNETIKHVSIRCGGTCWECTGCHVLYWCSFSCKRGGAEVGPSTVHSCVIMPQRNVPNRRT